MAKLASAMKVAAMFDRVRYLFAVCSYGCHHAHECIYGKDDRGHDWRPLMACSVRTIFTTRKGKSSDPRAKTCKCDAGHNRMIELAGRSVRATIYHGSKGEAVSELVETLVRDGRLSDASGILFVDDRKVNVDDVQNTLPGCTCILLREDMSLCDELCRFFIGNAGGGVAQPARAEETSMKRSDCFQQSMCVGSRLLDSACESTQPREFESILVCSDGSLFRAYLSDGGPYYEDLEVHETFWCCSSEIVAKVHFDERKSPYYEVMESGELTRARPALLDVVGAPLHFEAKPKWIPA